MTNSNRFNNASSSQIWDHLNGLDVQGIPVFASTTDRDARWSAPSLGARCIVNEGSGAWSEYFHNGAGWILWSATKRSVAITAAGWAAAGWGSGVWVSKANGMVSVQIGVSGTSTTGLALATLPVGFRPSGDSLLMPGCRQGWAPGSMHVQLSGVLSIAVDGTAATQWYASASFWAGA